VLCLRFCVCGEPGSASPDRADTGVNGETIPGYFPARDISCVTQVTFSRSVIPTIGPPGERTPDP